MSVRKFRRVEELPGPSWGMTLDAENLRAALGLCEVAAALSPIRHVPGVRKFRSWGELVSAREEKYRQAARRRRA